MTDDDELIPAATVILAKDAEPGIEVLMLRRNSAIAFGGAWVFPGGRVDPEDAGVDELDRSRCRRSTGGDGGDRARRGPARTDAVVLLGSAAGQGNGGEGQETAIRDLVLPDDRTGGRGHRRHGRNPRSPLDADPPKRWTCTVAAKSS